jgi:hypothetical protein
MQLNFDVTDVLDVEPPVLFEPAPIAVGREFNCPKAAFGFEARIAGTLARVCSPKERLESLVQPAERGLSRREVKRREARQHPPAFPVARRLFAVGDGSLLGLVYVSALAESKIIQPTMPLKHRVESPFLRAVGEEPELVCPPHLLAPRLLSSDVTGYRLIRDVPGSTHIVEPTPQTRHAAFQMLMSFPKNAGRETFELVCQLRWREVWRSLHEQMYVVWLYCQMFDFDIELGRLLSDKRIKVFSNFVNAYGKAILRAPHEVIVKVANAARCMPKLHKRTMHDTLDKNNVYNAEGGVCGTSSVA